MRQVLQEELQEVLAADVEKEASLLETLAGYERAQADLAALQAAQADSAAQLREASEVAQARHPTSSNSLCTKN